MSIELGQKYIGKDGEVVEVFKITTVSTHDEVIFFTCKKGINHVLFDYDFLEQYKPYEEPKQTVTIERWLCRINGVNEYFAVKSTSDIDTFIKDSPYVEKIKLLSTNTYEIELP